MNDRIHRQVTIARTPVHISTHLPEDVLQSVVAYVEEKLNKHEKTINYKSDDEKKIDSLIITLLDIAAELFSARQELKRLKQKDVEALADWEALCKKLDNFSK